jgi:hypothetical protein
MSPLKRVVSWWRDKRLNPSRKVWNMWEHRGWGDRLEFLVWEKRRISGHLPNRWEFKVGDEVRERMQGGAIARFRVDEVEYVMDPKDMLFATVTDIGYLEQSRESCEGGGK